MATPAPPVTLGQTALHHATSTGRACKTGPPVSSFHYTTPLLAASGLFSVSCHHWLLFMQQPHHTGSPLVTLSSSSARPIVTSLLVTPSINWPPHIQPPQLAAPLVLSA
ncbi:hypothetical protein GOP47_0027985 [Adiantum capillus-veneris]|nr:hypothetical protein GOP47_0027985 [Adiantum capillus-veneris]